MPISARRCRDCGRKYELLWRTLAGGEVEYSNLDRDDIENLCCPACDSPDYESVLTTGTGIELGGEGGVGRHYPYFDHGLGEEVRSAQHRRELCKARGLVPVEGRESSIWEGQADREKAEIEQDTKAWAAQQRQFQEGPNRQAYAAAMEEARKETERMREQERATVKQNLEALMEARERAQHRRR